MSGRLVSLPAAGLLAAALLAGLLSEPAWGAVLTITASRLTADAVTGVAVAEGGVRLTDGVTTATGPRLVLDTRRRTATLAAGLVRSPDGTLTAKTIMARFLRTRVTSVTAAGEATLAMRRGTLSAAQIELLVAEERLTASGGVRLKAPPELAATGMRLEYRRRTDDVTMAGPVTVQTAQGTITGGRLTGKVDLQRAHLSGPVAARVGAITATAGAAALDVSARTVTLIGSVRLRQGSRMLAARKVTVYYESGRVVAEGMTRLEIPAEPGSPHR
ncbi:MAG TPA: LptA/OstA family protein [bacterium]|jgi:lipopolysaccharide export system protein LptA|nr:LptA/OstA family protein [bacterium]